MGKSGGSKVQVTEYYMSQHFGVCSAVDAIKRIVIKEKDAWLGRVTERTKELIQKDNLFGGATKEGGATGTIYFLPGRGDQVLYDELANRLKTGATGADVPGYRGLTSIFFTGRPDANKGALGFYWTANNPYLPTVWVEVERAPVGLNPAYAMVPRPGASGSFPFETFAASYGDVSTLRFSPDFSLAYVSNGSGFEVYDLNSLTLVTSVTVPIFGGISTVNADGSFYVGNYNNTSLALVDITGAVTIISSTTMAGGMWNVSAGTFGIHGSGQEEVLQLDGGAVITTSVDYYPSWFADDTDGNSWAVGGIPSSTGFRIQQVPVTGASTLVAVSTSGSAYMMDNGNGAWLVYQQNKIYLVDKLTFAVVLGPVTVSGDVDRPFRSARPGDSRIWFSFTEYSTLDLSVVRTVDPDDWASGDTQEVVYDPNQHALWGSGTGGSVITVRLLDRGGVDANPAHIIFEALTNTEWGMGSPTDLIDVANFEAVGETLFNEPLGLSVIWTKQQTIQDFIQEILDHIQGVLFVDPLTGLLTLKLIRGDYDVDTLPTIDPSTATLTSFSRKLWGDIVNEISVTWTNPDNEQDETVTAQDLASITTQGSVVPDSRNYYGVRYAELAKRLAARDLRSAGAPLASCEAEVDRSLWYLRPASVLLVDWPEYGLSGVVMRVTSIDYGKPGDPTLKINLIEDVFGLDVGDYTLPPSSAWEDPSQPPTAMTEQEALTLPYYFAFNGLTSIDGASYPEVLAGVLGASSNVDASSFELWGEVTLTDGSTEWQSLATMNVVAKGELAADIAAEATSTGVTFGSFVGSISPSVRGFAIIGDGTEAENEIALITSASAGSYGLSRGVLDTVPKAWTAGTTVWFVESDTLLEDPTARSVGEVVNYKLLTRTSLGLLSFGAAPILTATLMERPWLPQRPANVTIGGVQFNNVSTPVNMIGASTITVSWSNRNRKTEDSVILGWTASTVTPEDAQTTTVTVLKTDLTTVLATHSGLTGTSFAIPVASFGADAIGFVRVSSERIDSDGTFESLQAHGLFVQVDYVLPVGMATETDTALALGRGLRSGVATETDTALALSRRAAVPVGMATETDTALALLSVSDPYWANVVLSAPFNEANGSTTFADATGRHTLTSNGNVQTTTTTPPSWQATCCTFDGTGDFITMPDSADWDLGSGDFTVEYFTDKINTTTWGVICQFGSSGNDYGWGVFEGTQLQFFWSANGTTQTSGSWTMSGKTGWQHRALSRVGNTLYICFDGQVRATASMTGVTIFNSSRVLAIGGNNNGTTAQINGRLSNVRITKGTGRYSGSVGASYTVPTAPYPTS